MCMQMSSNKQYSELVKMIQQQQDAFTMMSRQCLAVVAGAGVKTTRALMKSRRDDTSRRDDKSKHDNNASGNQTTKRDGKKYLIN